MQKVLITIILSIIFSCASELPKLKVRILNDYEFIHEGNLYTIGEFGDVFSAASQKIKESH